MLGQVLQVLHGHTGTVNTLTISIDGSKIVSGSEDKSVRVWGDETGQVLNTMSSDHLNTNSIKCLYALP